MSESVTVSVSVSVSVPVIVAALVNGNDTVGVIDTVDDDATGGWERPIARACSTSGSSTCSSVRSNSLPWHIASGNGCTRGTRTWPIHFVALPSRFRRTSLRAAAGRHEPTRPSTTHTNARRSAIVFASHIDVMRVDELIDAKHYARGIELGERIVAMLTKVIDC